ncbi:MAG TPA: ABC transporter ATP-binding protein [Pseudomonadales bacterium]|nr:ABC transporter ATP-binding protein [Pseudomonadales bacterium]
MSETSALECRALVKSFHQGPALLPVLRGIDLRVGQGERVAVLGRSGSGKSTLLHILGGLADPDSGEVRIDGSLVGPLSPEARARLRNRRMGFVYQFHHLLPEFTAMENVAMPLLLGAHKISEARERAVDTLESVGLGGRLDHRPSQLSGGERQRVAIARALVADPAVVLADEPTGNLDQESADQVFSVMLDLAQRRGTAFVVVTHDEDLARQMQRRLYLTDGHLIEGTS